MSTSKIFSIVLAVLMAISAVLIVGLYVGKVNPANDEPKLLNLALNWSIFLILAAAAVTVLAQIYQLIFISGNLVKTIIIVVAFAILVILSYTFASGEELNLVGYDGSDNVPKILKRSDMGLYSTYILFGLTIIGIILSEVIGPFKK